MNIEITPLNIDKYRDLSLAIDNALSVEGIDISELGIDRKLVSEKLKELDELIDEFEDRPRISEKLKPGVIFLDIRQDPMRKVYIKVNNIRGLYIDYTKISINSTGVNIIDLNDMNIDNYLNHRIENDCIEIQEDEWLKVYEIAKKIKETYKEVSEIKRGI